MREPESKEIEGCTYIVTPLPTSKGIALTMRLGKILGPTLDGAAKLTDQSAGVAKEQGLALKAIAEFLSRATEADLKAVHQPLAECTRLDLGGSEKPRLSDVFDVHFAGRLDLYARWLAFALEVNLGPLGAMLGSVTQLRAGLGAA